MCDSSKLADDWITKGCHIHIDGVELRVICDHRGGVDFRPVFSNTPLARLQSAVRAAIERCLPDPTVRARWIQRLRGATTYMLNYDGELASLANGRMIEFKYLRLAIERWA